MERLDIVELTALVQVFTDKVEEIEARLAILEAK